MSDGNITTVEVGEIAFFEGEGFKMDQVVTAPCSEKNAGNWFCLTHQKSFQNQLQKDIHIGTGDHHLVWLCNEHGAEKP